MTISERSIYPRSGDMQTVYLKNVVKNPNIVVGDYTMYHDFVNDPTEFERHNVLYHYPINHDRLIIGKFCSIACGAKFIFTSANHTLKSLSTYPFPLFFEEWELNKENITDSWDNNIPFICHISFAFIFNGYRAFGYKGDLHSVFLLEEGSGISVCMINVRKFHTRQCFNLIGLHEQSSCFLRKPLFYCSILY